MMKRRQFLESGVLGAGALFLARPGRTAAPNGFSHGVASGDPDQRGFVAWTRYAASDGGNAAIRLEVAEDKNFSQILKTQEAIASPCNDYCVQAEVEGLAAGRWYFYRFSGPGGETSLTGRSRTLPEGEVERFRVAVVSCSNATSGWFNAYAHLAGRDDIDLVVHLGDYIYESPITRADAISGMAELRGIRPSHELRSLQDYRLRYASYREDPDLSALHARLPIVAMMDDHESANNSWHGGAKAHDPKTEGPWHLRKHAALKAYNEWIPRKASLYKRFDIGRLASLFRLETRLLGRSPQIDIREFDFDNAEDVDRFRDRLLQPRRTMLGWEQERWLAEGLRSSRASGRTWQILAQQVIMAGNIYPEAAAQWVAGGVAEPRSNFWKEWLPKFVSTSRANMPHSMDKWDGYPAARQRLLDAAEQAKANLIVLSGDSHNAWAFDLKRDETSVGVDLAAPSVSSFGFDKHFFGDFDRMSRDFIDANPSLRWCDLRHRGFLLLDIGPERTEATWHFVPSGVEKTTTPEEIKRMYVRRNENYLVDE